MKEYDLVVVGGGSGGLAAAVSAYDNGVKSILVVEKEKHLGGILLQCIHNGFGLHTFKEELTGPEYAARFAKMASERPIDIKLDTMVLKINKDKTLELSSEKEGYQVVKAKAIVCATGCGENTAGAIGIPGDRPSGVLTAGLAQKYLNIDGYLVGKKVFILGSGDIGLIMARRMTLEGAKVLGVAELMPYSNGLNRNIVQCLNDYDIPLYLSHTVKQIVGKDRVEKIVIAQVDDHFNYIEGTDKEFECDTLLLSVGLRPYNPLLVDLGVKLHPATRGPIVDESLQTSVPGIFSCGNSLHVHDLVDFVTKEGKKAGENAAKYLKGELDSKGYITLTNGNGVGYTMPSKVDLSNIDDIHVNFRVRAPFKQSVVSVYQGDKLIKQFKKPYILPAEMQEIIIPKNVVLTTEDIKVEVENA